MSRDLGRFGAREAMIRAAGAAVGRIAVVLVLVVCAAAVRGDDPLSTADLVRFLRAGISERIILAELKDRGFADPLDAGHEAALREVGATETLIVAVRRIAPATVAPSARSAGAPAHAPGDDASFPSAVTRVHGPTFGSSTRTVRVPVSVLDKNGQPVMGLRGEDFAISEDGRKQEVSYFSGERRPLRIALALDTSASMESKIREVEDALRHFIDVLEPSDEILVITFSDRVEVAQDFTSDHERLGRVLNQLQPFGATALYDATKEAIERVAPGPAESKAVVLVTDGMDTVSSTSWGELRELARRSEVPVFSIGLGSDFTFRSILSGFPGGGSGWPRGPRSGQTGPGGADFDASVLLDLAEETGARAEILKGLDHDRGNVDRLKDSVESIAMTLRHRYLVGYEPPTGKKGWRKIKVDVDKPSASAHARKGYYAEG